MIPSLAFVYHANPPTDRPGDEESMLASVRACYPDAPLVRAEQPAEGKAGNVGAWIRAYLQAGLDTGADLFIRLDPDSRVLRPLAHLPLDYDVFGDVSWEAPMRRGRPPMVCGGVQGWTRAGAQFALSLLDCACRDDAALPRGRQLHDDPAIAKLVAVGRLRVFSHPEILARGQPCGPTTAIWHPYPTTVLTD